MLTDMKPSELTDKNTEDVYLRDVKRAYQAEGLAKINAGVVSEQSHHLFGLRNIEKLKITYRDVDYE